MVELLHKGIATSEASTTDPVTFWEEMLIVYIPKGLTKRARSLSTLFSWSAYLVGGSQNANVTS